MGLVLHEHSMSGSFDKIEFTFRHDLVAFNQPPFRHAIHTPGASGTLMQAFASDPCLRYSMTNV